MGKKIKCPKCGSLNFEAVASSKKSLSLGKGIVGTTHWARPRSHVRAALVQRHRPRPRRYLAASLSAFWSAGSTANRYRPWTPRLSRTFSSFLRFCSE